MQVRNGKYLLNTSFVRSAIFESDRVTNFLPKPDTKLLGNPSDDDDDDDDDRNQSLLVVVVVVNKVECSEASEARGIVI